MYGFILRIHVVRFFLFSALLIIHGSGIGWAASTDTGLIWKVTSGNATAYVVGSIHACKADFYPMPTEIDEAFAESEVLSVEVNMLEIDPGEMFKLMRKYGTYDDGTTLEQVLTERNLELLKENELDVKIFKNLKPWALIASLQEKATSASGYYSNLGIDFHFLQRAKQKGMPIKELEDMESQIRDISSDKLDHMNFTLFTLLRHKDRVGPVLASLFMYWRKGDVRSLEFMFTSWNWFPYYARHYEADQAKMIDRNNLMADRVEEYLADGRTHFVVMGCLHTFGRGSVIELLEERGYQVEQLGVDGGI